MDGGGGPYFAHLGRVAAEVIGGGHLLAAGGLKLQNAYRAFSRGNDQALLGGGRQHLPGLAVQVRLRLGAPKLQYPLRGTGDRAGPGIQAVDALHQLLAGRDQSRMPISLVSMGS